MNLLAGTIASSAGGGLPEYLHWRLNVSAGNDASFVKIAEVELRRSGGSADQAIGGTASASSGMAGQAFDDSNSTNWNAGAPAQTLAYEFSAPVAVKQVAITAGNTAASAADAPKDFTLEYSDNGSDWTSAGEVTGETGWSAGEQRLFNF